jgi:hypothetical protein
MQPEIIKNPPLEIKEDPIHENSLVNNSLLEDSLPEIATDFLS